MDKYNGKNLLVLGSNVGATDIVTYARDNGARVIVADYYPPERSAAKRVADVDLLISTADQEQLEKVVEEYHIDGVFSGISEFNILQAMTLAEKYNLPFYCTRKQWNMIEHKDKFRVLCETYGVPCPKTYYTGTKMTDEDWSKIVFPAVIKPVDACTSAGVHICSDMREMKQYEDDALNKSASGQIIVEEFVEGDEFTAHYTIAGGRAALSCVDNRYPVAVHEGAVTTVPVARIYPCTYLDEYMEQVNSFMIQLCEGIGIENGILFVQGLYNAKQNEFHIFEAGLRSAGEAPYRFIDKINGINAMYHLVDYALSVESDYNLKLEDPYLKGKSCGVVSFVARGATVGSITGLEEAVAATPSVIEYESRYPVGSTTPDGDTLRQLMIRFVMICDSREQMARDVEYLNSHVTVLDESGENMVIKLKPEKVLGADSFRGGE
jgi:biotin carboxylase